MTGSAHRPGSASSGPASPAITSTVNNPKVMGRRLGGPAEPGRASAPA